MISQASPPDFGASTGPKRHRRAASTAALRLVSATATTSARSSAALVEEVALDLDAVHRQAASAGYGSLSSTSTWRSPGADTANPAPERLAGIERAHAVQQRRNVRAAVTRSRLRVETTSTTLQLCQVCRALPARLSYVLRWHLGPTRLEQVSQIPTLPTADLERRRAARVEGASERRAGSIRNLTAREIARDASTRVGLRDRPQQRFRIRVLRVFVDRCRRAQLDDHGRDTGWRCGRRRTSPSRGRA